MIRDGKEYRPLSEFQPKKDKWIRFQEVQVRKCEVCYKKYNHPTEGHGEYCSHDCWLKANEWTEGDIIDSTY